MISGTFGNMAVSGREYTPADQMQRILNVLTLPIGGTPYVVMDPCVGGGNLLHPFQWKGTSTLVGVDISRDEITKTAERLPGAELHCSPIEQVRMEQPAVSLLMNNPPYLQVAGMGRQEYHITKQASEWIIRGGVLVNIIPARTAIDGGRAMSRFLVRNFERIQCWKFAGTEFDRFTQIVIVAVKRQRTLTDAEMVEEWAQQEITRIQGWRYHTKWEMDPTHDNNPWERGTPPPDLPLYPLPAEERYVVPPCYITPNISLFRADEATLLATLKDQGAWTRHKWDRASAYSTEPPFDPPLMPLSGLPHIAALLMTGVANHKLYQVGGRLTLLSMYVTRKKVNIELDEDDIKKNVVRIRELQDHAVLRVLDAETGEASTYEGEAVYDWLRPVVNELAQQVLASLPPRYNLNPSDWMVQVAMRVAQDKQLPGMDRAGLAAPQLERAFALYTSLCEQRRGAIQGTPGTGKTRMAALVMALMAYRYHQRDGYFRHEADPAWVKRSRKAWANNPHTLVLSAHPSALPLAVAAPMRTLSSVWKRELEAAFPDCEVVIIEDWTDVDRWMARCAVSDKQAVVAVFSHSTTRAGGNAWRPAVTHRSEQVTRPKLDKHGNEVTERVSVYRNGYWQIDLRPVFETVTLTRYFCPSCGLSVQGIPRGGKKNEDVEQSESEIDGVALDEETWEDVTSDDGKLPAWFTSQQRWCHRCDEPLWQDDRTLVRKQKLGELSYTMWERAVENAQPTVEWVNRERWAGLTKYERVGKTCFKNKEQVRLAYTDGRRLGAAPSSFSPYEYWHRKYPGICAGFFLDESHNARTGGTDISHSAHLGYRASQTHVMLSGTHYAGVFERFYHYWYMYHPRFWVDMGYRWEDVDKAADVYGITQEVTTQAESTSNKGTGQTEERTKKRSAPGISARILPRLLGTMACIDVLDVGALMPPKVERPILVDMTQPELAGRVREAEQVAAQAKAVFDHAEATYYSLPIDQRTDERSLHLRTLEQQMHDAQQHYLAQRDWATERAQAQHYLQVQGDLEELSQQKIAAATLQKGTLPSLWSTLGMHPTPYTLHVNERTRWGDIIRNKLIFTAPILAWDHVYPLERKLTSIIEQERSEERVVQVYVDQSQTRSMSDRLLWVLKDVPDLNIYVLPDSVDIDEREDALKAAVEAGHNLIIVGYLKVQEGLNLQFIDTTVWYEMAKNAQTLEQASCRNWRLGATTEKRIYYLALRGTTAHAKMRRLGQMFGASLLFRGDNPDSALAKAAGVHKTMLARLSSEISIAEEQAALDAAFAARNEQLAAQMKQGRTFIGAVSTVEQRIGYLHTLSPLPDARSVYVTFKTKPSRTPIVDRIRKEYAQRTEKPEVITGIPKLDERIVESEARQPAPKPAFGQVEDWLKPQFRKTKAATQPKKAAKPVVTSLFDEETVAEVEANNRKYEQMSLFA